MPTFTVIALDRLLEPGASSKSADMSSLPNSNSKPFSSSMPVPDSKLERRNSTSVVEKRPHRPQIRPALYATPEATPLPDSPTSFPPSPYIINHKRRGPRLMKSYSEQDVSLHQRLEVERGSMGMSTVRRPRRQSSMGMSATQRQRWQIRLLMI